MTSRGWKSLITVTKGVGVVVRIVVSIFCTTSGQRHSAVEPGSPWASSQTLVSRTFLEDMLLCPHLEVCEQPDTAHLGLLMETIEPQVDCDVTGQGPER